MGRWPSGVWVHASLWGLFSAAVVCLHGPIWEENYEFAQVLLGQIVYPPAHPLYLHAHNLFSLQLYLSALHLWLGADPAWANGLRNALYALAKTLPCFLLGAWLSRRVLVGHLAALAALLAAGEGFTRAYPTLTWPMFAGNGVIGMGAALVAVACLVCGRYGLGFTLAGAMPAIHLGQCPPLGLLCAVVFLHVLKNGSSAEHRRMWLGIASGSVITGLSLVVLWFVHITHVPAPPYLGDLPPEVVWGRWLTRMGGHQVLGVGKDLLIMLWAIWVLAACVWSEWRSPAARLPYVLLLVYTLGLCLIVWGIMTAHALLGERTPNLLLGWLPYRLPNHLAPIIAVVLAVRLYAAPGFARPAVFAVLALPFLGLGPENTFVALSAIALPVLARPLMPQWAGIVWAAGAVGGWLWCLPRNLLDTNVFLLALLAGLCCPLLDRTRLRTWTESPALRHAAPVLVAVALLLAVWLRPHLPEGNPDGIGGDPFEAAVAKLEAEGRIAPGEMFCVPHLQRTLQGRLHHPVTADSATYTWVPYHPEIGPALQVLYRDLYGVDIAPEPDERGVEDWYLQWTERSREEWKALGDKYGFRHVVTPAHMELSLDLQAEAGLFRLYTVPQT